MELVRLECDFPVIGGQQGSLLGLCVCSQRAGWCCSAFPASEGRGGPQLLQLGPAGLFSGWPARAAFGAAGQWDSGPAGSRAHGLKAVAEVRQRKAVIPALL